MKFNNIIFGLALILAFIFISCGSNEKNSNQTLQSEALNQIVNFDKKGKLHVHLEQDYPYDKKKLFEANINKSLNYIDNRLDTLSARIDLTDVDTREKYREELNDLKFKSKALRKKMEASESQTEDVWNDFTNDIKSGLKDIETEYNKAVDEIDSTK